MLKIAIVNESFTSHLFYRRWELFAETYRDMEVFLLAPQEYICYSTKENTFGNSDKSYGQAVDKANFHIRLFRRKQFYTLGWISPDFKHLLNEIQPDVIYNIGTHTQLSLRQLLHLRKLFFRKSKMIAFSMRGPSHNISHLKDRNIPFSNYIKHIMLYPYAKSGLRFFNNNCDAVLCHYPDAVKCFREEGYKGPVYMCTQVGVNTERYYPDSASRDEIRQKYNIGDAYLFGSATRFSASKGLDDVIDAMPADGNWKYLMMGWGNPDEIERIQKHIAERHLEDKIILTGLISRLDMPKYFNALDCAIHTPRTTRTWEETFSIAVVQAMATEKPIIGNTSGSVPYQIGPEGIIVNEGDIEGLHEKIEWVLNNQEEAKVLGTKMKQRAVNCFGIIHLNECFYDIVQDVMSEVYDKDKMDMAKYKVRNEAL